jgi:5'-nucleotidase
MKISFVLTALAAATLPTSSALKILLGNDDGWAAANIREFYRLLKKSGHDVILVAPVVDNSGQGGRVRLLPPLLRRPTVRSLTAS